MCSRASTSRCASGSSSRSTSGSRSEAGREPDELPLAAREDAGRLGEVVVVEAHLGEQRARAALEARARPRAVQRSSRSSCRRSSLRHPIEVRPGGAELRLDLRELRLELVEIGPRGAQRLERVAVVALELLRQEREHEAAPLRQLATVGGLLAGEDAQQRRLAAAVRADQAQAGARLDVEVEPVEDRAASRSSSRRRAPGAATWPQARAGGTRLRRGGGSRRATGGRRRRSSTRPSCARAGRDPRACRGTAGSGTSKAWISAFSSLIGASCAGHPLFQGSTSQT